MRRVTGAGRSRCSWVATSRNGGPGGGGELEVEQRPARSASATAAGTRSATTRTPWISSTSSPRLAQQRRGALHVVAAAQGVLRSGAAVRVGEQRGGDVEVAGRGAGEHGGRPAGDQHARRAAGAQRAGDRGDHPGRVVDHLEHRVAEHQVDAARLDQAGERVAVALDRPYPVGDPGVVGPPGQRGERVRAGVDDRDVVARLGQRHGEPAGAAADVEHGQRAGRRQLAAQHRPDDRGARAGACRCSLHPQKPNARFAGTGVRISPPARCPASPRVDRRPDDTPPDARLARYSLRRCGVSTNARPSHARGVGGHRLGVGQLAALDRGLERLEPGAVRLRGRDVLVEVVGPQQLGRDGGDERCQGRRRAQDPPGGASQPNRPGQPVGERLAAQRRRGGQCGRQRAARRSSSSACGGGACPPSAGSRRPTRACGEWQRAAPHAGCRRGRCRWFP